MSCHGNKQSRTKLLITLFFMIATRFKCDLRTNVNIEYVRVEHDLWSLKEICHVTQVHSKPTLVRRKSA